MHRKHCQVISFEKNDDNIHFHYLLLYGACMVHSWPKLFKEKWQSYQLMVVNSINCWSVVIQKTISNTAAATAATTAAQQQQQQQQQQQEYK